MKTEYKKVSDLLALNDKEVLQEFEMVELKGGISLSVYDNDTGCQVYNAPGCQCHNDTQCTCWRLLYCG